MKNLVPHYSRQNAKQPTASENTTMIPGLQQNRPQSQLAAYGTCTKLMV